MISEIFGVFTSNLAALFFAFGTGVILSRVLGPELKGMYTSLLVIPGIIASIAAFGTRQSSIYHIGKKIFSNQQVISALTFLFLMSSSIGIALLITYHGFRHDNYTLWMIALAVIYIPIKLLITYSGSVFLANVQFKKANRLKWLTALLTLLTVVVFVYVLRLSVVGALVALILASLLVLVLAIYTIAKDYGIKIHFDKKVIITLFRMGIIYAIALFIIQLNFRLDIMLLDQLSNKTEIGYYSIGVSVAEKLWQIPFAIGIVVISRSASTSNMPQLITDVGRLMRLGVLTVLMASVVLYFIVPFAIPFLYGHAFSKSISVVQTILPGIVFFVVVRVLASSLAGLGKPWIIIWVFLPALVINVILNLFWIPPYGCIGASWATNVSYTAGALGLIIAYARIAKVSVLSLILFTRDDFKLIENIKAVRKRKRELKNFQEEIANDDDA